MLRYLDPPTRLALAAVLIGTASVGLLGWSYIKLQRSQAVHHASSPSARPEDDTPRRLRDGHVAQARALLDSADYSGAVALLDRALQAAPGDAEALALQVRAFRAQRHYTAARSTARRILDSFPQSPLAHILLGSIAMQEGDATTARRDLDRAVELDTSSALALAELAALDLMEGKAQDAARRAAQALALDPAHTTALRILARVRRSVPDLVSIYRRLLEASPGDVVARSWLEALQASRAPEVNYIAPLHSDVVVPCETGPDGRLYARAVVGGGEPFRLLLDTGASGLVISEARARRMGLRLREFSESAGVGGLTRHSHPVLIDRIDMGGMRARALMATASNLPSSLEGIINPVLFAAAGRGIMMELRPSQRVLIFSKARGANRPSDPRGGRAAGDPWVTVPFLADGNHIIFDVVLGGRPATALLDTGAAVDMVDRSVLARFPGATLRPASRTGASLIGFGGKVEDAETLDQVTLRIAGRDFVMRRLFLLDLNEEAFRFQVDLDAIIGMERLGAFDIRIDPTAGLVAFRPRV